MEIQHKHLGPCKILLQFEGHKNQMALVKPKFTKSKALWMLWCSIEKDLNDAGRTKMQTPGGYTQRQSPATRKFMEITKYVDDITFRKLIKNI
jgi:hypothetical protein